MKIFGYRSNTGELGGFGVIAGIVIADSEEEAKNMIGWDDWKNREIFEIPFVKSCVEIAVYDEI